MATPEQIQQEKAARRAAIRNEYWRTMTNPHGHLHGESGGVVSFISHPGYVIVLALHSKS